MTAPPVRARALADRALNRYQPPAFPNHLALGAFERGVAALRQYKDREGHLTVPRAHTEVLGDGTQVRLGVWLSNTKSRRATLTPAKLAQLAEIGLHWA